MRGVIWLQIPQNFGWVEEPFLSTVESTFLNYVRQNEIRTAEQVAAEPTSVEV
jgi:hypothetical protein